MGVTKKYKFGGWENCVKLENDEIELVVTTDIGPRIIRFAFKDGQNLFKEFSDQIGKTGGDEWRLYGGHRLWHAPEEVPRTYFPDNDPVGFECSGNTVKLIQDTETTTGIQKEIEITLDQKENSVKVLHRLINKNLWELELTPWALSVMANGGRAIIPQEPYQAWEENKLPVRSMVMWSYNDMKDPRWIWGSKYIQLKQEPEARTRQKLGLINTPGWAGYYLNGELFVKRYGYDPDADYVDLGCNTEIYTDWDILEVETLGGKMPVAPGGSLEHLERWYLFKADLKEDEESLDNDLKPLIGRTSF